MNASSSSSQKKLNPPQRVWPTRLHRAIRNPVLARSRRPTPDILDAAVVPISAARQNPPSTPLRHPPPPPAPAPPPPPLTPPPPLSSRLRAGVKIQDALDCVTGSTGMARKYFSSTSSCKVAGNRPL